MERPIKRQKESWPGVILTALGCLAFLVWWFRPVEEKTAAARSPAPGNLLAAALEIWPESDRSGELDEALFVLALQASHAGDETLAHNALEGIRSAPLRAMARLALKPDSNDSPASGSELAGLLEKGDTAGARAQADAAPPERRPAMLLEIAEFLTRGGDFAQAKALVKQLPDDISAISVDALLRVAQLHAQWGNPDEAEAILAAAEKLADSGADRIASARCAFDLNFFDRGETILDAMAERAVIERDTPALQRVAEAWLEFGQIDKARQLTSAAYPSGGDESVLWNLRLSLEDGRPLAETLELASSLQDGMPAAAVAIRDFCFRQFDGTDLPKILWNHEFAPGAELRNQVDQGKQAEAATAIDKLENPTERAKAYLSLAHLLLWRASDASQNAP